MVQLVKLPTPDFSSDLEPNVGLHAGHRACFKEKAGYDFFFKLFITLKLVIMSLCH